jgi:hypothetical protein
VIEIDGAVAVDAPLTVLVPDTVFDELDVVLDTVDEITVGSVANAASDNNAIKPPHNSAADNKVMRAPQVIV